MSDPNSGLPVTSSEPAEKGAAPAVAVMPTSGIGWLAVGLTAVAVASLIAVMLMAGAANDPGAVDSRLMIASGVLLGGAGLTSLLCVTFLKQRSVLNILAVVVCAGLLGLLLMLGLGGFFNGVF